MIGTEPAGRHGRAARQRRRSARLERPGAGDGARRRRASRCAAAEATLANAELALGTVTKRESTDTAAGHRALAVAVDRHLGEGRRARSTSSSPRRRRKPPCPNVVGREPGAREEHARTGRLQDQDRDRPDDREAVTGGQGAAAEPRAGHESAEGADGDGDDRPARARNDTRHDDDRRPRPPTTPRPPPAAAIRLSVAAADPRPPMEAPPPTGVDPAGRRAGRRALLRARRVARLGGGRARRAARGRPRRVLDRDRRATASGAATAGRCRSRPARAARAPTSCSPRCTGRSARTAPSRGCSRRSTWPTSAPASPPRRSAWTRSCSRT